MPDDSGDLRQSLEAARKQLAEKDTALREVHHRAKNNLQLIMSLMGIRARDVDMPEVRRELEDMAGRVGNLAHVEDVLHRSPDLAAIDFAEYLQQLAHKLLSPALGRNPKLILDLQPMGIPTNRLIPLGLLATELLLRAQREAEDQPGGGEIRLALNPDHARGSVTLSVLGTAARGETPVTSMGRRLLEALARQAEASLSAETLENGTLVSVRFSINPEQ
jgi:two-component sensor histidine kinase